MSHSQVCSWVLLGLFMLVTSYMSKRGASGTSYVGKRCFSCLLNLKRAFARQFASISDFLTENFWEMCLKVLKTIKIVAKTTRTMSVTWAIQRFIWGKEVKNKQLSINFFYFFLLLFFLCLMRWNLDDILLIECAWILLVIAWSFFVVLVNQVSTLMFYCFNVLKKWMIALIL